MKQSVRFRAASAAAKQPQPRKARAQAEPAAAPSSQVSFANDIVPIFQPYRDPMMWRFDLTSYDAVRANAEIIFGQISTQSMPPPPISPLTAAQIATFKAWMDEGYPP
jgi:hypothetical protein